VILCSEIEVYRRFERTFTWGVCKFVPDCTALHRRVLKHSLGCGNLNAHNHNRAFTYRASLSLFHYRYLHTLLYVPLSLLSQYTFVPVQFCLPLFLLLCLETCAVPVSPAYFPRPHRPPSTLCHLQPPETAPSLRLPNLPECFSSLGLSWVIPRKTCSSNIAAAEMDGQRKYTLPAFPLLHTR